MLAPGGGLRVALPQRPRLPRPCAQAAGATAALGRLGAGACDTARNAPFPLSRSPGAVSRSGWRAVARERAGAVLA